MVEKAKWTFIDYMAGDNSLLSAGKVDLKEIREVGSMADVNVVAEFDNEGDRKRGRRRHHNVSLHQRTHVLFDAP